MSRRAIDFHEEWEHSAAEWAGLQAQVQGLQKLVDTLSARNQHLESIVDEAAAEQHEKRIKAWIDAYENLVWYIQEMKTRVDAAETGGIPAMIKEAASEAARTYASLRGIGRARRRRREERRVDHHALNRRGLLSPSKGEALDRGNARAPVATQTSVRDRDVAGDPFDDDDDPF